jgi:hypothetical protein
MYIFDSVKSSYKGKKGGGYGIAKQKRLAKKRRIKKRMKRK